MSMSSYIVGSMANADPNKSLPLIVGFTQELDPFSFPTVDQCKKKASHY
jgi:hypothetical protein